MPEKRKNRIGSDGELDVDTVGVVGISPRRVRILWLIILVQSVCLFGLLAILVGLTPFFSTTFPQLGCTVFHQCNPDNKTISVSPTITINTASAVPAKLSVCTGSSASSSLQLGFISATAYDPASIFLTSLSGAALCRLNHNTGAVGFSWSPTGKQIYIACTNRLCAMDIDGNNPFQVNPSIIGQTIDDIDVSSDGLHLVFSTGILFQTSTKQIYIMDIDGSHLQPLFTISSFNDISPRWSPDHQHIVFVSDRNGVPEIYVTNIAGDDVKQLVDSTSKKSYPAWSPDGKQIAFVAYQDGNDDIFSVNADGTNLKQLTNNPAGDNQPDWSPDGKYIAFSSNRDGIAQIYVMNSDGTNQHQLLQNRMPGILPRWLPLQ